MVKLLLSIFILLVLPAQSILSQNLKDDYQVTNALKLIEMWVDAQMAYEQIPGISMSIVYDQEEIWSSAFGFSDLENKKPMTTETICSICSISKLFTSIGLMQLRDKGLVELDEPIDNYLPWFNIRKKDPDGPSITIRGILSHSSGLPRESDYAYWNGPDFEFPSHEQIVEKLGSQETLYPAFKYYQYSNLGLTLAGEILSEVSKQDFKDYINLNLLQPLGLKNTRPEMPRNLWGKQLAKGYSAVTRKGNRYELPFFNADGITPAAGFSSTAPDLAKFAMWQLKLLYQGDDEIFKVNSLREMQRVQFLDPNWKTARGLGFGFYRYKDITFVGHEGSCPGYRSALTIEPECKIAVVFMANANGANAGGFSKAAYTIIAPAIKEFKASEDTVKMDSKDLDKFTGIYNDDPWGGETAVFKWKDGLAISYFPTDNPLDNLEELKQIDENSFRRIRKDGELGETISFQINKNDNAVSLKRHSYFSNKVK